MGNDAKIVGRFPSAPAEWNVALRDVVFSGLDRFNAFLAAVGVTADRLEFDPVAGRAKGLNGTYSVWNMNGEFQLTGFGIALLHQATNGNLDLVRSALFGNASVDRKVFFSSEQNQLRSEDSLASGDRKLFATAQAPDQLELELKIAETFRRLYPTANLKDFSIHFNQLVSDLRGGIPYSDRDGEHDLTPGKLLKFYMLSFALDGSGIRSLTDQAKKGGLSLLESIRCLTDEARSKKFLSAVREAVTRALDQERGPVEVIDAGCGAVPIQAIQAAIIDTRVRVTALEFNPASAAMAKQIVHTLGLEKQISVVHADATTFAPENKAHVVVSETLQAGLGGEPVVQILNNLSSHLKTNGRIIPESVEVKMGLLPLSEIRNSKRTIRTAIEDVKVTDPDWLQTFQYTFGNPLDRITFSITPAMPIAESSLVCVGIEVNLGNEVLSPNESLITMPRLVFDVRKLAKREPMIIDQGQPRIVVSYQPGDIPVGLSI